MGDLSDCYSALTIHGLRPAMHLLLLHVVAWENDTDARICCGADLCALGIYQEPSTVNIQKIRRYDVRKCDPD